MERKTLKERISGASTMQWIKMIILNILCLLFIVWSGYYLVLIVIPFFFDAYITKYIPWTFWKKSKNEDLKKAMEWVDAISFALVAVYFINTFFFQNYQIPTSSLEKSLLVGDFLFVSKINYGARSPMTPLSFPLAQHTIPFLNIKSYIDKPQIEYKRLKGFGSIKRNDIVVFNFPAGDTVALKKQERDYYSLCLDDLNGRKGLWTDKFQYGDIVYRPVDRRENYVKRCVGLPGETIEMRNDSTFIDGKLIADPENVQYFYAVQTDGTVISPALLSRLGVNKSDQSQIKIEDISYADSSFLAKLNLVYKPEKPTLIYSYVALTPKMAKELETHSFVLKVMKNNKHLKFVGELKGEKIVQRVYPITYDHASEFGDFPALWIPKRGATIKFDSNVPYKIAAYERCIKNYEHNDFSYRDGKVYINGVQADSYTFKYDYYFMMGDNRDNSADSRVWGFVPEDHVVGQPIFIWLSLDQDQDWFGAKIRWDRIFTSAKKH